MADLATSEVQLDNALDISYDSLTDSERESLSKALFPETHTDKVVVLGEERVLSPLPIKYSRKLNALLTPVLESTEKSEGEEAKKMDEVVQKALADSALVLAERYGWEDVKKAVAEEELALVELESLALVQQELNSANDFLLRPLRVLVRMLQAREIAMVKMEGLGNTSITLPSLKNGAVPLTS